jgi:hypothetical protein
MGKGAVQMKLYDVPRFTWVYPVTDVDVPVAGVPVDKGQMVKFHHIDGMYSYCTNVDGDVVHLPAWQEVEVLDKV